MLMIADSNGIQYPIRWTWPASLDRLYSCRLFDHSPVGSLVALPRRGRFADYAFRVIRFRTDTLCKNGDLRQPKPLPETKNP